MKIAIRNYREADLHRVVEVINAAARGDLLRMVSAEGLLDRFSEPGYDVTKPTSRLRKSSKVSTWLATAGL